MPDQHKQSQDTNTNQNQNTTTGIQYLGYIFLLGLITLVAELIDLRAGEVLEYLLQPFTPVGENTENDVLLAADFEDILSGDSLLTDGFIPIGFE